MQSLFMGRNNDIKTFYFVMGISLAFVTFLWSLDLMTDIFQVIANDTIQKILSFTSNPFIGLFIGLFITAVIQSSSTSTSLIIAIVASGGLSLEHAVPMIMGSNIGTTLTSTIVSLGFITDNKEFKHAIATGVMHDFFNILTVALLFPLEYYYHILSKLSKYTAAIFHTSGSTVMERKESTFSIFDSINSYLIENMEPKILIILLAFACLFTSIKVISKLISNRMLGVAQEKFQEVFFKNTFNSFGLGTLLTAAIQSSSITTSIIVPIGALSKIPLARIFPYIVGANIGTTITALIAALNKSEAALSIALVHFFLNLIGTCIFLIIPTLRNLPIKNAIKFGDMTMQYRIIGFLYILGIFFILPLALIFLFKL